METLELIFTIILGLVMLFAGYRIKKITFFIAWFIIGHYIMKTYLMGPINSAVPEIAANGIYQTLLPIAGGVLLGCLGFTIEKLCVAGITLGATMMITTQYFGTEVQTLLIGLVIGVILAGVATALMKPAYIVATSAMGAYLLTIALIQIVTAVNLQPYYFLVLLAFAAIGITTQFSTTRGVH